MTDLEAIKIAEATVLNRDYERFTRITATLPCAPGKSDASVRPMSTTCCAKSTLVS